MAEISNCVYCGANEEVREHVVPWSWNHSGSRIRQNTRNKKDRNGTVPCCKECNNLASDKVFATIEEKREYISERLEKRYKNILKLPDWSEDELNELDVKLKNHTKLKLLAKQWITNRISYPNIIYPELPIRAQVRKILNLF